MFRATLLLLISFIFSFAQYDDPSQFFPMQVGNAWEWSTENGVYREEIVRIEVDSLNRQIIYLLPDSNQHNYIIDSNIVYSWDMKFAYYKLDADSGEGWLFSSESTVGAIKDTAIVIDTFEELIFGK